MSKELLKKVTVKVSVSDGEKCISGSGVIAKCSKGNYYVITAEHCIGGKKESRLKGIAKENIHIRYKENNQEDFQNIIVNEIAYKCKKEDIAVLSIQSLNGHISNSQCFTFSDLTEECDFHFRGYPKWLNSPDGNSCEAKTFKCYLEETDCLRFFIKADEIQDNTLQLQISETAHGLSGSGVFIIKDGVPFLIGIVTDLRDDRGTFGHISCKKLDNIIQKFELQSEHLKGGLKALQKWAKVPDSTIEERVEELKKSNSEHFERLYRKCSILYEKSDVDKMVFELLRDYFTAEINLKKIGRIIPILEESYEEAEISLTSQVKRTLNKRQVKNKNEAQDIFQQVIDLFKELFQEEAGESASSSIVRKSSNKAVTGLLLNCDLDFKEI